MLTIYAPAKLNLCLDILKKTSSGYHEIRTVFIEHKSLQDTLLFNESQEESHVSIEQTGKPSSPNEPIPKMKDNLSTKALNLLKNTFNIKKNAKIIVQKAIPIAAGLGGASSDAAATLKGLNQLWNLNLSQEELLNLATQLGADVAFFMTGGTALGEHFGEKITQLPAIENVNFEIDPQGSWPALPKEINPTDKTKQMYEAVNLAKCGQNRQKTEALIEAIKNKDIKKIMENLHNDFETILPVKSPSHLSGAGPATFKVRLA